MELTQLTVLKIKGASVINSKKLGVSYRIKKEVESACVISENIRGCDNCEN